MSNWKTFLLSGASVAIVAAAAPALAQTGATTPPGATPTPAGDGNTVSEVVVTGTLIRGVAPVGTDVLSVSRTDIQVSGVTATDQLLATIPVVTSQFNTVPTVGTTIGISTIRPNIRNIGAAGGTTTLVLMDGHNLVGAGVLQTTPDAGVVPPGALERVDVVPDGGSSLYGSDAVGGIINFITRKHFEGVEAEAHAGFADHYRSGEVNVTGGYDWGKGSFLLSYDYRANTDLIGANRSYFRQDLRPFGGSDFRGAACAPGNVTANGVNYALPGLVPGTMNLCDTDLFTDIVPQETQNSVFGSFTEKLSDRLEFDLTGYWTDRKTRSLGAQDSTTSATITAANPFFIPLGGALAQTVSYSYAGVFGNSIASTTALDEFGLTPSLDFDLGGGWDLNALGYYGRSDTAVHTPQTNPVAEALALAGTTTQTALDPYDLAMTSPSVLQGIHDFENFGRNVQQLGEGRLNATGPLWTLPGGDIKLAAGAQYQYQSSDALVATAPVGDLIGAATANASRDVESAYGELFIPIFGTGNGGRGYRALNFDVSARYDNYSDFGGTTNPKVGLTYQPFEGLSIRANYGASFNAPSLADSTGAVDTRAQVLNVSPFLRPGDPFFPNFFRPTIILAGGNPGLKPQTANTFSVGGDFRPDRIPGLDLGLTYWNVDVYQEIGLVPFLSPLLFTTPAYQSFYIVNPTLAQAEALTKGEPVSGATSIASLYANPFLTPYIIINATRNNLGDEYLDGLDFNADYVLPTRFGALMGDLSGSYTLGRRSKAVAGAALFDELTQGVSRLYLTAAAGAVVGNLTTRLSVNYTAGFDVAGVALQTHVGSFHPVNLYLAYDFKTGMLKDLTLSLNIDNIADDNPAFENVTNGVGNGSTVGRFVNFGVRKKF